MNEPQVWTLIGVFAAGMYGTITVIATMFLRIMRTEFTGVRGEIESVRKEIGSEFSSVRTEIRAVHGRIDHLDRDVNAIYRHLFGIDRG